MSDKTFEAWWEANCTTYSGSLKDICKMAWDAAQPPSTEAKQSIPEGWKLVPVSPTQAMLRASWNAVRVGRSPDEDRECYRAMLEAAPEYVQQSIQQEKP